MPEELDPTTARLAAELASNILPSLTKSLSAAIPSADFTGVFERSSRAAQDLRTQVEKIIRSDIEENRAARSVLLQSISSILDEMTALKKTVERLPGSLARPEAQGTSNQEIMSKLEENSSQLEEIIHGIKSFAEAYASDKEQQDKTPFVAQHIYSGSDAQLEKLLTGSLPSLEGLLRANAKAQSKELEDFSRELSTQLVQKSAALIHEVRRTVAEELSRASDDVINKFGEKHAKESERMRKMFKMLMIMSGASITLSLITIIMMIVK